MLVSVSLFAEAQTCNDTTSTLYAPYDPACFDDVSEAAKNQNNWRNKANWRWINFIVINALFLITAIACSIYPFCCQDKALGRVIVLTAFFCLWLQWCIVYMSQFYMVPGVIPVRAITA